jgi:uracil-DNA glycosylase
MNNEQRHTLFLQEMGFPVQWQSKHTSPSMASAVASAVPLPTPALASLSPPPLKEAFVLPSSAQPAPAVAAMNWRELSAAVAACTACSLCRERRQTVFGRGNQKPRWLLIGDTPNEQDEAEGSPFAAQEGSLLNNMLRTVGLSVAGPLDSSVYFTNLVKCRAQDEAGNTRPPNAEEIRACRPFLQRQIQLMQPRLILALGKSAAQALRSPDASSQALRGVVHRVLDIPNDSPSDIPNDITSDIPMVATWHPSILLRQPAEKRQVWADLCLAKNHDEASV